MRASTRIGLGILAVCLAAPVGSAEPPGEPVRIEGERIVLATPFRFSGPVLEPALAGVQQADALAAFLIETPGIVRMSIEAHGADGDIRDSIDPGLRRARLIRDGLIRAGVDPLRVEAISFGEQRPIADPPEPESKAIDRRIELRIVQRRPPGARDEEAAEMIALSRGAPPERAALCQQAEELLDARGAGPLLRGWVAYWLGPGRRASSCRSSTPGSAPGSRP